MTEVSLTAHSAPDRAKVVEQIALTLQSTGLKKVAFASAESDPGTASLATEVAEVMARSGLRTLVIDLSGTETGPHWVPGGADAAPVTDALGRRFDVLSSAGDTDARAAYNNPMRVANALDVLLGRYDLVVLHLAGLLEARDDRVNAVAAGAAADGIVLVCPTVETTVGRTERVMQLIAAAGGKVVGTVLDDRSNPLLSDDMSRSISSLLRFMPPLQRWFGDRIRRSEFLRTPIFP